MREDVPAMESGDKGDFKYQHDFVYPAAKVDRRARDIKELAACHRPLGGLMAEAMRSSKPKG